MTLPLYEEVQEISISPIPVGDFNRPSWAVIVTFGGREVDGVKLYGVKNLGRALSRDGTWDHEPIPSSRTGVTTHGVLLPHWGCRWCHCTLTARGWSLMCDRCDRASLGYHTACQRRRLC
jgi:hypothetical protein